MGEDSLPPNIEETKKKSGSHEIEEETNRLLRVRNVLKNRRPDFIRQESWRYKKLKPSWRRPKGIDSKMRTKEKGWPKSVEVGYRSPKKVRGFHPSGFEEVTVYNMKDLEKIDQGKVIRIGHNVGLKKRLKIVERAKELKIHVINPGEVGKIEPKESEKTSV